MNWCDLFGVGLYGRLLEGSGFGEVDAGCEGFGATRGEHLGLIRGRLWFLGVC